MYECVICAEDEFLEKHILVCPKCEEQICKKKTDEIVITTPSIGNISKQTKGVNRKIGRIIRAKRIMKREEKRKKKEEKGQGDAEDNEYDTAGDVEYGEQDGYDRGSGGRARDGGGHRRESKGLGSEGSRQCDNPDTEPDEGGDGGQAHEEQGGIGGEGGKDGLYILQK